jgi:1-acyl-sn-glycerol-3-phosphate acyltransferase
MAKDAVFRHKVAGPLMRGMHHIPVDRSAGAASYAHAVEVLREGEIVGVFPEATISRSFELKEFKTGAVRMARDADVPVLPLVLWGTQRLLTKGRSPKGMKRRHLPVTIVIGEPFRPGPDADPLAATAELKERMQGLLETARDNYPGRPWPGEEPWWLPRSLGGTAPTPQEAAAKDAAAKQERSGSSPPAEPDALPPA